MHQKICIFFILINLISCFNSNQELGKDYFLREEGKGLNEVLNYKSNEQGIPPNILRYNYNSEFIIAEQKPLEFNDVMHDIIKYKNGRDSLYYWIIIKSKKILLGPYNKQEFVEAKKKRGVPSTLELNSIY